MILITPYAWSHRLTARPVPWLLLAAVYATALDLGFAALFWAGEGVAAIRIPQSIASWLLGRAAFDGGLATAMLGTLVYLALMWALAALYSRLSRIFPRLLRQPNRFGLAYGALMYGLVFHVGVPLLTAAGPASQRADWIAACVLAYMVLVGLPCAWASRWAAGRD
ncbi:hypothetical protein [Pseudoxanthomonas wuyuanensis]|uniref:Uncharacterized protein n=1 Tax=Pseudoxanthomonas wuyuanensis TaxID=1073196 RepID=A0A286DGJ8_9GAMM|nr:hypothetical protein [Pseudoxanthomonas wuyuanensis]KAF1716608.1 hypothetical protein CSC75_19430 [Pseudoxanthomonas wuyuanensis]SOD57788.1 hypothetical protein SAMN06296416_11715 [Pseudoxanthomonas wuyuanensis]